MRTLGFATLMAMTSPVWAGDVALLIANENYDNGRDIRAAEDLLDANRPLVQYETHIANNDSVKHTILQQ